MGYQYLLAISFVLPYYFIIGFKKRYITRAVSRDFLGTLLFKMVIFPYGHHGCLRVRKLWVFNTLESIKTYPVVSNTLHWYHIKHINNLNHLQETYIEYVKMRRNDSKFTIGKYHINMMEIIKLFPVSIFMPVPKFPGLTI